MTNCYHPIFKDTVRFICETLAEEIIRAEGQFGGPNVELKRRNAYKGYVNELVTNSINLYGLRLMNKDTRPDGERFPYYCQGMLEDVIELLRDKHGPKDIIEMLQAAV